MENTQPNVQYVGFRDLDSAEMDVISKEVNHAIRHFTGHNEPFEGLRITKKEIHKREHSEIHEVHAHLRFNGKTFSSEIADRNLMVAIHEVLKKVTKEAEHDYNKE